MGKIIVIGGFVFVGVMAWRVGALISPDAVSMAVGLLFGVLAGIPVALLALFGQRTTNAHRAYEPPPQGRPYPPVIILNGHAPRPLPPQGQRIEHVHRMEQPRAAYAADRRIEAKAPDWPTWTVGDDRKQSRQLPRDWDR